jgi:hypothetical protein
MISLKQTFIVSSVFFVFAANAQGQPEKNVGSVEIDVVDQYKASIKKAAKISEQPGFADTTTKKLPVQYRIKPQQLTFTYNPQPIKPVRIKGVRLGKLPKSMVKLGGGIYTTTLLEAVLTNSRAQKFNWEVGIKHFRSQGGVKQIEYDKSPFTENTLYLGGRWLLKDYRVRAKAGLDWNRFHYYGVPENAKDLGLQIPDLQYNDYQRFFAEVDFSRIYRKNLTPFESAALKYHYFTNNWQSNEHRIDVTTAWHLPKEIQDQHLGAELNFLWQKSDMGLLSQTYDQINVQFMPKAKGKYGWFTYTIGLNFNLFNTGLAQGETKTNTFAVYFYPEIALGAELVRDVLGFFAGWTGDVTANGQYSLQQANPFVLPANRLTPTGRNKIYAGLEGVVAKNVSYKAEANYQLLSSLPLFFRSGDSLTMPVGDTELPAFAVQYASGDIFQIRGELTYNGDNTMVSAFGEVFSYNFKNDVPAYHLPNLRIGLDALHQIKQKIDVKAGIAYVGGREALATDGLLYKADMKDIWDAYLGVGYRINNNLSAGMDITNLASQQYDIWLGYPAQRFRILFNLMYQF